MTREPWYVTLWVRLGSLTLKERAIAAATIAAVEVAAILVRFTVFA